MQKSIEERIRSLSVPKDRVIAAFDPDDDDDGSNLRPSDGDDRIPRELRRAQKKLEAKALKDARMKTIKYMSTIENNVTENGDTDCIFRDKRDKTRCVRLKKPGKVFCADHLKYLKRAEKSKKKKVNDKKSREAELFKKRVDDEYLTERIAKLGKSHIIEGFQKLDPAHPMDIRDAIIMDYFSRCPEPDENNNPIIEDYNNPNNGFSVPVSAQVNNPSASTKQAQPMEGQTTRTQPQKQPPPQVTIATSLVPKPTYADKETQTQISEPLSPVNVDSPDNSPSQMLGNMNIGKDMDVDPAGNSETKIIANTVKKVFSDPFINGQPLKLGQPFRTNG